MEKHKPLFSIILPTFNRAEVLRKAIKSVTEQSFGDWELIVIDDGSTDHTASVVADFNDERIQYIFQEKSERSIARNLGIEKSSGSYLTFLDDDDYYLSNHLLVFFNYLNRNGFPKLILRSGFFIEKYKTRKKQVLYLKEKHRNPVSFFAFHMCGIWTLCIPRSFLETELFPASFPHWQDTHLILRLLAKHPFVQLNIHTYVYVLHPGMGSLSHFEKGDIEKRVELNVSAIRDLFKNYSPLLMPYLPDYTLDFLINEKYLGHAIQLAKKGEKRVSMRLYKKTFFMAKLWKQYLKYWIYYSLSHLH